MWRMADFMRAPNLAALTAGYENGTPGIMMIAPVVAQRWRSSAGPRQSIRQFLWENSRIPAAELRRAGCPPWIDIDTSKLVRESVDLDPWPITASPTTS